MAWEDQETVDGCEWVGHLASQLRINQTSEEVLPGYRADVARATMWKVCMVYCVVLKSFSVILDLVHSNLYHILKPLQIYTLFIYMIKATGN